MNTTERVQLTEKLLEQIALHLNDHFEEMIAIKGDDGQINFGFACKIETAENGQHTVATKLGFSEKHSFLLEEDIADPNQPDLGGEIGEAAKPKIKRSKKT